MGVKYVEKYRTFEEQLGSPFKDTRNIGHFWTLWPGLAQTNISPHTEFTPINQLFLTPVNSLLKCMCLQSHLLRSPPNTKKTFAHEYKYVTMRM